MRKLIFFLLIQVFLTGSLLNAQKISVQKGSFDFIKGQKSLLATFDYSNMGVGKFDKEDDYIADRVAAFNKNEAGKGEKWLNSWKSDRESRYEPKFETLFNENGSKVSLRVGKKPADAQYEINIHTVFTEPGFNVGVMRKNAFINVIVTFRKIASGDEVAVLKIEKCPGRDVFGADFDTGVRIEEAYAKLGKAVAVYLVKQQ